MGIPLSMSNNNFILSQGCLGKTLLFKVSYISDPLIYMSVSMIKEAGWK